jgi:hypothetical protein
VGKSQYWGKGAANLDSVDTSFKNCPTIFGTALASDLKALSANQHSCALLQYMDDLRLAGPTQEDCMEGIPLLISLLWEAGYKVSRKKARLVFVCTFPGWWKLSPPELTKPERYQDAC